MKKDAGLTLIELMVAVSLTAIIAGLALPSFRSTLASNSSISSADQFSTAVRLARSEAMRRGVIVKMTPIITHPNSPVSWSNGWLVWIDQDNNDIFNSNKDLLLLKQTPITGGIQVTSKAKMTELSFGTTGYLKNLVINDTNDRASTFDFCPGNPGQTLLLKNTGDTSVVSYSCPEGDQGG